MHVDDVLRTSTLVQIIDVLSDDDHLAGILPLQKPKRFVSCVGLDSLGEKLATALVVEAVDEGRITTKRLRGGDVFDPVVLPQAVDRSEGANAGFRGDAGAGQDHDASHDPMLTI